ncbi:hypothetical protein C8Q78DRAFT_670193 [Trametes maxima]|nr:hypothetical protein C8Q78DRAFT_670193 [Trametes maxima]
MRCGVRFFPMIFFLAHSQRYCTDTLLPRPTPLACQCKRQTIVEHNFLRNDTSTARSFGPWHMPECYGCYLSTRSGIFYRMLQRPTQSKLSFRDRGVTVDQMSSDKHVRPNTLLSPSRARHGTEQLASRQRAGSSKALRPVNGGEPASESAGGIIISVRRATAWNLVETNA